MITALPSFCIDRLVGDHLLLAEDSKSEPPRPFDSELIFVDSEQSHHRITSQYRIVYWNLFKKIF